MNFFLKMIGTTDRPLTEPYTLPYADFTFWPRQLRPGDIMVLYAVGAYQRVFALVKVESRVRPSGVEQFPYRVDISYIVNLPPSSGVHLDEITFERNLLGPIQRGSTYFKLKPEEYALAGSKLRAAAQKE